jgi:hypothetical protein
MARSRQERKSSLPLSDVQRALASVPLHHWSYAEARLAWLTVAFTSLLVFIASNWIAGFALANTRNISSAYEWPIVREKM